VAQDDELIAGRYRLGAKVGSGAMGVVWRAEDERLRRTVALKQVRLPGVIDDQAREQAYRRVMREGRLFARLHHPNAIAVFDVVEHEGQPWLVMEYLPSRSLSETMADSGVLDPLTAARVGHQVAAALTAAHEAGIVHRDVKPGNVLIGDDGVVKVTDFGISRAVDEATVTSDGMVAGTPAYLAPEVARGGTADFRSDVYSLGSTLYAATEGEPPFGQGENALAQLHRVATGEYVPPRAAGALTSLLERLLEHDPARRPEMHQVRDELGRLAAVEAETDEWPDAPAATAPTVPTAEDGRSERVPLAVAARPTPTRPTRPGPPDPERTVPAPAGGAVDSLAAPAVVEEQDEGPRPRRGRLIAAGLAVVLVLAAVAVVLVLHARGGAGTATASGTPPATTDNGGATGTDQAGSGADTSGGADSSGGADTSGGAAAPSAGTPQQVAQQQAIIDYYGLIPTNLQEGWQRLTPDYQRTTAGGFDGYSRFWGSVRRVTVRGVSPAAGDAVDATVTYVHQDGSTSQERTLFRMVEQDGQWKIDGSQVLSSR
jgi:eukaryotic-like serine/threonine-protein kinase